MEVVEFELQTDRNDLNRAPPHQSRIPRFKQHDIPQQTHNLMFLRYFHVFLREWFRLRIGLGLGSGNLLIDRSILFIRTAVIENVNQNDHLLV